MPTSARTLTLTAALTLATCTLAHAQDHATWPLQAKPTGILPIVLVTVSEPSTRHTCRVHSITTDAVTCGVGPLRKPVVYPRDNVAALILPPTHATRVASILELTAGVACLAGSFFVPAAALAITLRVVGGLSMLFAIPLQDEDHDDDEIAYQRPNTPLTLQLRTH